MTRQRQRSVVRIGPMSILTLLVVIALAVLSVLALTTAHAAAMAAQRQDAAVQATYNNESNAQAFCATVDASLAKQRAQGATLSQALEDLQGRLGSQVSVDADAATITRTFSTGYHDLTVTLALDDALQYQIEQWRVSSSADTGEQLTLWAG